MTADADPVARLVDELMLVSVLVAGEGEAALAASLEAAGASATILAKEGAAEGFDLAILAARPDAAASPATRALVVALSAASERLLFAPSQSGQNADQSPQPGLPELPLWFELFAEFGYQPVVEFDAGFLAPGAFLVDRAAIAAESDLAAFADRLQRPDHPAPQAGSEPAQPVVLQPARITGQDEAELAGLRASLAASRTESAALSAQLEHARQALAQAQAQAAGWETLRLWVRAAVADPARNTREALARDLPRLNALRTGAPPVSLPPERRRFWRRGPAPVPPLLRDAALLRASPLFDPAWYAAAIPDLADAPLDPVFHYLLVGAAQGADPGPWFDSAAYREAHPELAPGEVPLLHAIRTGAAAGIAPG